MIILDIVSKIAIIIFGINTVILVARRINGASYWY